MFQFYLKKIMWGVRYSVTYTSLPVRRGTNTCGLTPRDTSADKGRDYGPTYGQDWTEVKMVPCDQSSSVMAPSSLGPTVTSQALPRTGLGLGQRYIIPFGSNLT